MANILIKRLNKDLRELLKNPVPGVGVEPVENDIKNWHFTLLSPEDSEYRGIPFHGHLEFTEQYPIIAPRVYFHHYISGSGGAIFMDRGFYSPCMSINSYVNIYHRDWEYQNDHGWTTSSNMIHFFYQLKYLMFVDILTRRDDNIALTRKESLKFKCNICQHDGSDASRYYPIIQCPNTPADPPITEPMPPLVDIVAPEPDNHDPEPELAPEPAPEPLEPVVRPVNNLVEALMNESDDLPEMGMFEPICLVTHDRIIYAKEVYGMITKVEDTRYMVRGEYMSKNIWDSDINYRKFSTKENANYLIPLYFSKEHWEIAREQFLATMNHVIIFNNIADFAGVYTNDTFGIIFILLKISSSSLITEKKLLNYFLINQTIQQLNLESHDSARLDLNSDIDKEYENLIAQKQPTIFDHFLYILINDPERLKKLVYIAVYRSIYNNKDTYKAMYPEILDFESNKSTPGKATKIFNCIRSELTSIATVYLIAQFNMTYDFQVPINDHTGQEWVSIFKTVKQINTMQDLFSLLSFIPRGSGKKFRGWSEEYTDYEVNRILTYFDKRTTATGAHGTRLANHNKKKAKLRAKSKNSIKN